MASISRPNVSSIISLAIVKDQSMKNIGANERKYMEARCYLGFFDPVIITGNDLNVDIEHHVMVLKH